MKNKHPKLASKFMIKCGLTFYGNNYFKKQLTLNTDYDLSKLEPPYVVVANHCGFVDVAGIVKLTYPHCGSFVISETQIVKWPSAIHNMGILPKKQFTVDTSLIRDIKYVLDHKRPVIIFPEAKLSVVGQLNIIKPATAKLIKMLKVPLVTVCYHGAYLHKPRWAKDKRFVPATADIKIAVSKDEVGTLSVEEIHNRIVNNLTYDDYRWQKENGIAINSPTLTEGLEHILYKCPHCGSEFVMSAHGNTLTCNKCGSAYTMDEYGVIDGKYDNVVDWYKWQTECVKEELTQGSYGFSESYRAEKLVGKNYVDLGDATVTHDENGITVTIVDSKLSYPAGSMYTLSFNNDYIYLPTAEAVYRFVRQSKVGSNTKLNIAIEQQTVLLGK